jgi:hypothetical protein
MPFAFNVPMPDGSTYKITELLAEGQSNIKTAKSDNSQDDYLTYSLSLAPSKASGFNLCPSASPGCIKDCLFTSGRAITFPRTIQPARIAKSRFFMLYRQDFLNKLNFEIDRANRKVKKIGAKLCIRLNVFSDIVWERVAPNLFEQFSDITWYDYTKIIPRMEKYLNGGLPPNYHLTFSRSENNWSTCIDFLNRGANVAVPFAITRTRALPATYLGYPVIDGDLTDLRFLDPQGGYIIGLRAKGEARSDKSSGFVVQIGTAEGRAA